MILQSCPANFYDKVKEAKHLKDIGKYMDALDLCEDLSKYNPMCIELYDIIISIYKVQKRYMELEIKLEKMIRTISSYIFPNISVESKSINQLLKLYQYTEIKAPNIGKKMILEKLDLHEDVDLLENSEILKIWNDLAIYDDDILDFLLENNPHYFDIIELRIKAINYIICYYNNKMNIRNK